MNLKLSGEFLAQLHARHERWPSTSAWSRTRNAPHHRRRTTAARTWQSPCTSGHLRSAIIGESIKRIYRFFGNHVIGDIHLGDWGLQMGLIIARAAASASRSCPTLTRTSPASTRRKRPSPSRELEEIYPAASAKSKVDAGLCRAGAPGDLSAAVRASRGYRAMWKHIMRVSVADLKRNYENLNVSFDVWLGRVATRSRISRTMLETS